MTAKLIITTRSINGVDVLTHINSGTAQALTLNAAGQKPLHSNRTVQSSQQNYAFSNKTLFNSTNEVDRVIGPQYLILNNSTITRTNVSVNGHNGVIVNIVPLEPNLSVETLELASEGLTTLLAQYATYAANRFIFPPYNSLGILNQDYSEQYDYKWVKNEHVLVDEMGLPRECAVYVEKVLSFLLFATSLK